MCRSYFDVSYFLFVLCLFNFEIGLFVFVGVCGVCSGDAWRYSLCCFNGSVCWWLYYFGWCSLWWS